VRIIPLLLSAFIAGEVQVAIAGSDEIARGRRDFMDLCADCHGEDAAGSGPLTINLTKIPPDLTRIKLQAHGKFDDKAIFDWIIGLNMPDSHGTSRIPQRGSETSRPV
jgi:cytochrome c